MQDRSDDELKKGLEAQATLINAEREVGVRAVVEVLREFRKAVVNLNLHGKYPLVALIEYELALSAADELIDLSDEQP